MSKNKFFSWLICFVWVGFLPLIAEGSDPHILKSRVPTYQIDEVRTWKNPLPPTPQNIEKGKELFHGKAYCVTCHGKDGKGYDHIPGLVGKLPRNFTDKSWQAVRTDGELMWILKNGSSGTAMVSFVPETLTEKEAWKIILFIRTFSILRK
jgi:cytochrome c553